MEGEHLGPYRIDRTLGVGGMGTVYAGIAERESAGVCRGDAVALKVVHPHLLETEGFFKRFLREAHIGATVDHPNLVRTLDCDQLVIDGRVWCFLVMELVEGQTLSALLAELECVPEDLCHHVAREICKALVAIHDAGVVHRDLKPENVLITPDHVVKVMDLGVARLADENMRLSQSGAFIGSVEYAAPEQFGGDVDHRCDLHALGLLLYELSCGEHPFRGEDFRTVMGRVCNEAPRRLGELHPQLSPFFEEVVHCLLAKNREDRFGSAQDLLEVLEEREDSAWWRERAHALRAATRRPLRRIRIPRETAVYGREAELDRLRGLLTAAVAGEGRVVLLEGEAGIGKSRLVDEFVRRLAEDGEEVNFLFGSYPPGGAATAAGGFSAAYREHFGAEGSLAYLDEAPLLAPGFDAVLRGEPAPEGVVPLTRDSLGTCFVHVTRALAADRPTIVMIDDLHFAPEEAHALFSTLARTVPGHRVLLIGSMRPGVVGEWLTHVTRCEHATRLELPRLGPKQLAALLRDAFGSERLAEELAYRIGTKSDGNPFFAFEIIRGLREGQFITQRPDGTWVSTQVIDDIQIPSSVRDLVNARVADLSEPERDLLDVACCWGYEFDPGLVGEALGVPRIPLLKQFGQIERKHRLVRASGRQYVFDHHQVQEALYASMHEQLREEYHAGLASALERRTGALDHDPVDLDGALCVDLCRHFLDGAQGASALRYLEPAHRHLQANHLSAQAAALSERALGVPGLLLGSRRGRVLLDVASALHELVRREREAECAIEAEELARAAGDLELQARAARVLGAVRFRQSEHAEAEEILLRSISLAERCGDPETVALATGNLGLVHWSRGDLDAALRCHDQHRSLADEAGIRASAATALSNRGLVLQYQGRLDEALDTFRAALRLSQETGHRSGELLATGNIGFTLQIQGNFEDARAWHERYLRLSRELGSRIAEAGAVSHLGTLLRTQDRLIEARDALERCRELNREMGVEHDIAVASGNLSNVLCNLGEIDAATTLVDEVLATARGSGSRPLELLALVGLARLARERGDGDGAVACATGSLDLCADCGLESLEANVRSILGSLQVENGVGDLGRAELERARDHAARLRARPTETLARCELACLPDGDPDDAVAAVAEYEQLLTMNDRREARLLLWRATGDPAHLREAKRLLVSLFTTVPSEYHAGMIRWVRVNRGIQEAWHGRFGSHGG